MKNFRGNFPSNCSPLQYLIPQAISSSASNKAPLTLAIIIFSFGNDMFSNTMRRPPALSSSIAIPVRVRRVPRVIRFHQSLMIRREAGREGLIICSWGMYSPESPRIGSDWNPCVRFVRGLLTLALDLRRTSRVFLLIQVSCIELSFLAIGALLCCSRALTHRRCVSCIFVVSHCVFHKGFVIVFSCIRGATSSANKDGSR